MNVSNFFQQISSVITPKGRKVRRFARDFGLELSYAFYLVRLAGSVRDARQKYIKDRERHSERPFNTYTSGSRLSS